MQFNRNPWKKIWNNRNIASVHNYKNLLKKLMIANGHIGKNKKININDWKKYSQNVIDILNPKKEDNLFEVGCGAGALLYILKNNFKDYGGCDYSKELVSLAIKNLNTNKIYLKDAKDINTSEKYDYVIASSLFEYVNKKDAKKILFKMIKKSRKKIFISELLKKKMKNNFIKKFKRNEKSNIKYSFFDRSFFLKVAKQKKLNILFFSSLIPNSEQKKYRYSVLLSKKNV